MTEKQLRILNWLRSKNVSIEIYSVFSINLWSSRIYVYSGSGRIRVDDMDSFDYSKTPEEEFDKAVRILKEWYKNSKIKQIK